VLRDVAPDALGPARSLVGELARGVHAVRRENLGHERIGRPRSERAHVEVLVVRHGQLGVEPAERAEPLGADDDVAPAEAGVARDRVGRREPRARPGEREVRHVRRPPAHGEVGPLGLDRGDEAREERRVPHVVVVDEREGARRREGRPRVARGARGARPRSRGVEVPHGERGARGPLLDDLPRGRVAHVVGHDERGRGELLREDGGDRLGQELVASVRRDHDGHVTRAHGPTPTAGRVRR
jgi:hypothetical protein